MKLDRCRELGADVAINYKEEDFVARVKEETGGRGAARQRRTHAGTAPKGLLNCVPHVFFKYMRPNAICLLLRSVLLTYTCVSACAG